MAVTSLAAIGKQDTFLNSSKVNESFFNPLCYKRHTDFVTSFISHEKTGDSNTWPFGSTVDFYIDPSASGDMLAGTWLKCSLPGSSDQYCSNVGHTMIRSISVSADGTQIDRITSDWMLIHRELFLSDSDKNAIKTLINGTELFIPLYLFFSRDHNTIADAHYMISDKFKKPFFPLCAMYNQKLKISIDFQNIPFFSNTADDIKIDTLKLITMEYTLTDQERFYYKNQTIQELINVVGIQPVMKVPANSNTFKNLMTNPYPVKSLHWFLRRVDYETDSSNTNFENRFTFSTDMTDAEIRLNGTEASSFGGKQKLYKYLQPYEHHLSSPANEIYTYSFSISPKNPQPMGTVDIAVMDHSTTYIYGKVTNTDDLNMHLFYMNNALIEFKDGFCRLLFA
jgi:hypothetical protein